MGAAIFVRPGDEPAFLAPLLHERFGVARVARSVSLGYWSDLMLMAWRLPRHDHDLYAALDALGTQPRIDVRRAEDASLRQHVAFADEAIERLQ